ncbi:DNA-processing protein DprA [Chitinimonas sp. PSY-7]|uniref:DNA-processing protein DprA n=1 Tax=Chitinimonas sp. PSY-7 TaxID=3459088 RepID=UPI0040400E85
MREQDSEAWLRLMLVHGMGPAYAVRLLSALGTPSQVLDASVATLSQYIPAKLAKTLKQGPMPELLEVTLRWLDELENRLLTLSDPDYPPRLLQIADPPPLLYLKGNAALLGRSGIAVVGSRNATPQGVQNAEAFSRELSLQGWCITSGLALGIDAAAHRGGLMGPGSTVAVVGTGLDIVYPARNHALAHEIARSGAIISEFPLGTPAKPGHFPRRNRIISGLARGVLVVEAALQSGSLITAREAAEQGREVFAIPGSIHSPVAKGCHLLIKQGAKLVETAADILDELGSDSGGMAQSSHYTDERGAIDAEAAALLAVLGYDPVDIDTLTDRAGLTPEQSYAMLLTLELDGRVAKLPGGRYQRLV